MPGETVIKLRISEEWCGLKWNGVCTSCTNGGEGDREKSRENLTRDKL